MSQAVTVVGIDEAGRGPVLGPLVMCGALIRADQACELRRLGVRDSKCLSPARREQIAQVLEAVLLDFRLISISPEQIDCTNLNYLELEAAASLIRSLKPTEAVLDAPTRNCAAYARSLQALLEPETCPRLLVENFADATYPVVGAASILAKVTRDREIARLACQYGELGSGYPGDGKTRTFLRRCVRAGRFPPIVRRRWRTVEHIEAELTQRPLLA